jgi:hypothetical protein
MALPLLDKLRDKVGSIARATPAVPVERQIGSGKRAATRARSSNTR